MIVQASLSPLQRIRAAFKGMTSVKADLKQRYDDYTSILDRLKGSSRVVADFKVEHEVKRLTELFTRVDNLIVEFIERRDGPFTEFNKKAKRAANWDGIL